MRYNIIMEFKIDRIRILVTIADQYWATARLMWTLGIIYTSMGNLNHAVELYMRAVWLTEQTFTNENDMNKALNGFHRNSKTNKPHDYQTMLEKMPESIQEKLKEANINGFSLVSDSVIRYGENPGLGYGSAMFHEVDKFIRVIRTSLGYKNPKNQLSLIAQSVHIFSPKKQAQALRGVKLILNSSNIVSKRKIFKDIQKRIGISLRKDSEH